jgi:crossover junction endodeoxyribonuclease RusA
VTYYFESTAPDVDNMVKPIQDALAGIAYENDRQVADSTARKRVIYGAYRLWKAPRILAQAITAGPEFVHVQLLAPDLEDVI